MTDQLSRRRLVLATAGTMLSLLLAALDQTIVGTALPRIVGDLQGLDYYSWVVTAYLVSSTAMTPIAGKLGDLFGRKPFMVAGMVGFMAGSALCGLSQNMGELVGFRALQGLFGGFLFASVFSVIGDLFPPERRGRVQGLFGAVFGLSSIVGPFAGGYLTDNLSWRWVFYVNIPVGLLALAVVLIGLPYVRSKASWRDIDFFGAFSLVAFLVPLLVALSITRDHAWGSPEVVGLLGFAAVMLALFLYIESRNEHPILPLELFRNSVFTVSILVAFLTAFGMFGTIIYVPLLFQGVLGVSATNSGTLVTPMMLGLVVASTGAGWVMTRIKYYRFLGTAGILIMMAGLYLLSTATTESRPIEVTLDIIVVGLGLGVTFPLYLTAVQAGLPRKFLGVASSQVQFFRTVGGTVGTAVLGTILSHQLPTKIQDQITSLNLPPAVRSRFTQSSGSASPQSLFDPNHIARTRASLPAPFQPLFDQVIHATRVGLANTLHDIFLYSTITLFIALIITVFLKEVPLPARGRTPEPVPEEAEADRPVATPVG
jgi:EmrB/QacA subfamily drug resistance transporter